MVPVLLLSRDVVLADPCREVSGSCRCQEFANHCLRAEHRYSTLCLRDLRVCTLPRASHSSFSCMEISIGYEERGVE